MPNTCPSDEFAFIINYSSYCNSRISIWLKLICPYNSALRLDSVGGTSTCSRSITSKQFETASYSSKALAKRLYISLDFCYTFVLQKSSNVLCCGQTVRHFTIQFIRLSNLEACLHRRFFPFAKTTSKITQKSADFHDKMECDRRTQLYRKIYQSVSVYFMKVNEK